MRQLGQLENELLNVTIRGADPGDDGRIRAYPHPLHGEHLAGSDGKRGHPARLGIALMLEELRKVFLDDVPQNDSRPHVPADDTPAGARPLQSNLRSMIVEMPIP